MEVRASYVLAHKDGIAYMDKCNANEMTKSSSANPPIRIT